jgi:hypothetical protein
MEDSFIYAKAVCVISGMMRSLSSLGVASAEASGET